MGVKDGVCPICGGELNYGWWETQDCYFRCYVSCQNSECGFEGDQWDKREFTGYTQTNESGDVVAEYEPED